MVTGRGKTALVEHFDVAYELEAVLRERNKLAEIAALRAAQMPPGAMVAVRQQEPLGLGHAIWCARAFIGDDPFAILLPDDLILSDTPCTQQLAEAYRETGGNVVAVVEVPPDQTNKYGILATGADDGRLVEVKGLVEKPKPEDAPSNLSIIGRYVLLPDVIEHLSRMERGAGNEVQLTDGMAKMIGNTPFHGLRYEGRRFDCGDKIGFLEANVAFALARPEMAPAVRAFLKNYQDNA
jgi:UTP--glucose-1-phosphate uridylyltransferase